MWKAFQELPTRLGARQPAADVYGAGGGVRPVVKAFETGTERCEPWPNPRPWPQDCACRDRWATRLMRARWRESNGGAVAVADDVLTAAAAELQENRRCGCGARGWCGVGGGGGLRQSGALTCGRPGDRLQYRRRWLYQPKPFIFSVLRPMRIAILDPSAGISGDMTLGGAPGPRRPVAVLEELPARLGLNGVT